VKRAWFIRYHHNLQVATDNDPVQPTFAILGSEIHTAAPPAAPWDPVADTSAPHLATRPPAAGAPSFLDSLQ